MTIKHVLVPLSSDVDTVSALGASFLIARQFNAHLDATFYKFPLGGPVSLDTVGDISVEVIRDRAEAEDDQAMAAQQLFKAGLEERRIAYHDAPLPATTPSAAWRVVSEAPFQGITRHGGAFDLIVVGRSKHDSARAPQDIIQAALFRTGRPVLVAPPDPPHTIGSTVLVGWNRSPQSVRAILAASPFLELAQKVVVFSVATGAKQGPPAAEIGKHLDWHRIRNEVVEVPPDYRPVGEQVLEAAELRGADLVVMGAYSHSRLKELLLGGVTQHVLENATLAVLMMR